jgi:hypothetical protein
MSGSNRFASMSERRSRDARLSHDQYETPDAVTNLLLDNFQFEGPILEPAAGSRRISRCLEQRGYRVLSGDIRDEDPYDYLADDRVWPGDVITNPPYHQGMGEAFVCHALAKAKGDVAMLLEAGFLWGRKRANGLFAEFPPTDVLIVPWRIRFHVGDKEELIKSQAYNHVWCVWRRIDPRLHGPRIYFPSCPVR